jgi:CubicO group peptidase (beta-lactamase class C family)
MITPTGPTRLRLFLTVLALLSSTTTQAQEPRWPTSGWAVSTPEAQGLEATPLLELDQSIREGTYGHINRLVVVRNGYLVVNERYQNDYREISHGFTGALGCGHESCADPDASHEYNYYHPTTHPYYRGRGVHSLQSVTKSVAATLIGVAIERGEIDGLDAKLLSFFDDYDLSRADERLHHATLEDLLTMRSGIEWHENDRPLDETNTVLQLEHSDDWIQFTLDLPTDAEPGEKWVYNSGGSHLMSGIIRNATGRFIDEYAVEQLFGPLGIEEYHWKKTPRGFPDTEGGLYLEAEQLAKIGYLYLHDGVWDGQRLLPEGWVDAATARQVELSGGERAYGYQWWRVDADEVDVWAGLGFGGQLLLIVPAHDLVGVINSWNVFDRPSNQIRPAFLAALLTAVGP